MKTIIAVALCALSLIATNCGGGSEAKDQGGSESAATEAKDQGGSESAATPTGPESTPSTPSKQIFASQTVMLATLGSGALVERPRHLGLSGDGTGEMRRIRWTSWGGSTAVGHGRLGVNDCVPDCADGTFTWRDAEITLSNVGKCRGYRVYLDFSVDGAQSESLDFSGHCPRWPKVSGTDTTEEASAIKECGNKPAGGAWTYDQVQGAGLFNLTTRNVSCDEARSLVDQIDFSGDTPSYPGWTCEFVTQKYEFADIRCTSGIKVVRFQTGA